MPSKTLSSPGIVLSTESSEKRENAPQEQTNLEKIFALTTPRQDLLLRLSGCLNAVELATRMKEYMQIFDVIQGITVSDLSKQEEAHLWQLLENPVIFEKVPSDGKIGKEVYDSLMYLVKIHEIMMMRRRIFEHKNPKEQVRRVGL